MKQMLKRFFILLSLILLMLGGKVYAVEMSDTIYLFNDEMITGEIKEMRLGKLTVDTKNVGMVDIKVSKIQTINTSTDTFRIETADEMLYYGVLRPANKDGYTYIVSPNYIRLIAIGHINSLIPAQRSFRNRLQGNFSTGFSYTHSSAIGQLTLNSNIYYSARNFNAVINASTIGTIDTTSFAINRADFGITGFYNLKHNNRWYVFGQVDYQRNTQLAIARRYQETVGGGRKLILSPGTQFLGLLGLSINQELSMNGKNSLLVEVPVGVVFNFFKFSSPDLQITSENMFYTSLSQKGRVRYDMNTSFNWELIHNFWWSITFYYSFDSKPPDDDASKNDYGTTINITFKF